MPSLPRDIVETVTAPPTAKRIVGESANGAPREDTKLTDVTRGQVTPNQRPREPWRRRKQD